jgi:hypothetical protein
MTQNIDPHMRGGACAAHPRAPAPCGAFDAPLNICASCAHGVREFQTTTARPTSSQSIAPPAWLKAAVLARIPDVRQDTPRAVRPRIPRPAWPRHR